MKIYKKILGIACVCILELTSIQALQLDYQESASEVIMNSLDEKKKNRFLKKLYKQLFFVPVWMHENKLSSAAKEFFGYISNDQTLDKSGKLYQIAQLLIDQVNEVYAKKSSVKEKVNLEFKISQLYEAYTNYAYFGSINWGAFTARISNLMVNDVNTEWVLHRPHANPFSMLENVALGASLVTEFKKATPKKYRYQALQNKLAKYRKIKENGGWLPIRLKGVLKANDKQKGVLSLRERLRITKDYIPCNNSKESSRYDACLVKAVKSFQKRNGLVVDGEVGAGTLKVLNTTVDARITTLLLNLDRIKWLKKRTASRHIIINIPDFKLTFEENGELRKTINTVVGKPKNPTPIFSNLIQTVVLNPYWNLPKSIIQKEMIPKLIKNKNAMKRKNIEIRDGWGRNAKLVNPSSVDWASYRYSKSIPFRFAQLPGRRNALGKLKFLFPNKYAVYMHDTPMKKLFSRSKRAFSHGCIRLEEPRELLKIFSTFNKNINYKKSQKILKGKNKTFYALKNKVPIDVIYLTSWVDYDGKLQFRNDIYGYDKMQLKSFRRW